MTQHQDRQRIFRAYREAHNIKEADLDDVVRWAVKCRLMELPRADPFEVAKKSFAKALREEYRRDDKTGRTYRANLAVTPRDPRQPTLWGDIDEVDRRFAHQAFQLRRRQMVGDAVQLSFDVEHWNGKNPAELPIHVAMDFTDDVEEARIAALPSDEVGGESAVQ